MRRKILLLDAEHRLIDWRNRIMAHQIARYVLEHHKDVEHYVVFIGASHVPGVVHYLINELKKTGKDVGVSTHPFWRGILRTRVDSGNTHVIRVHKPVDEASEGWYHYYAHMYSGYLHSE